MANYDNLTMDEILELKRAKEAELASAKEEVRELARAEERLIRFDDLKRRMGGAVTPEDLELLGEIVDKPAAQTMSVSGIDSTGAIGTPGE